MGLPAANPTFLGPLIVLSGPSGVGKSTVVAELLKTTKYPLRRAITATSRTPRPGEVADQAVLAIESLFFAVDRTGEVLTRQQLSARADLETSSPQASWSSST